MRLAHATPPPHRGGGTPGQIFTTPDPLKRSSTRWRGCWGGPFRRPCRFHSYYYTYTLCCDWTSNTLCCTLNLDRMPLTVCYYSFYPILSTHILRSLFLSHNWLTFTHTCNAFVWCTTAIHTIIHVLPLL
jgi:hypothetical protein